VVKARVLSIIPTSPLIFKGRVTTTESIMMIMDDCEIIEYTPFLLNGIYTTGSRLYEYHLYVLQVNLSKRPQVANA
jgi:hypothetical protein